MRGLVRRDRVVDRLARRIDINGHGLRRDGLRRVLVGDAQDRRELVEPLGVGIRKLAVLQKQIDLLVQTLGVHLRRVLVVDA